jgi:hypothetical protein
MTGALCFRVAALVRTDEKYVKAEGFSLTTIKGCVPVEVSTTRSARQTIP